MVSCKQRTVRGPVKAMFKRLLIPTNLADGLPRLVNFIPELATNGLEEITFLHSCHIEDDSERLRQREKQLSRARELLTVDKAKLPPGVKAEVVLETRRPMEVILEAINKYQPDLVLMSRPPRSLLDEKIFGSSTIGVIQRTCVPVMIVRPHLFWVMTSEELALRCQHLLRHVMVPYDHSPSAQHLLAQIKKMAQEIPPHPLTACTLVWVINNAGQQDLSVTQKTTEAEGVLADIEKELGGLGLRVKSLIKVGSPVAEVEAVAHDLDIHAIALSSAAVGKIWELSIPSFAGEILRRSVYPIIYFPPFGRS